MLINLPSTNENIHLIDKYVVMPVKFNLALKGVEISKKIKCFVTAFFQITTDDKTTLLECAGIASTPQAADIYIPAYLINKLCKNNSKIKLTLSIPMLSKNASFTYDSVILQESSECSLVTCETSSPYLCQDIDNFVRIPYYQIISKDGGADIKATFTCTKQSQAAADDKELKLQLVYTTDKGKENSRDHSYRSVASSSVTFLTTVSEDNPVTSYNFTFDMKEDLKTVIPFNQESPLSPWFGWIGYFTTCRGFDFADCSKVNDAVKVLFIEETPNMFDTFKAPHLATEEGGHPPVISIPTGLIKND